MADTPEPPDGTAASAPTTKRSDKGRKPRRAQHVYTLVIALGRKPGDGLPEKATGGGLLCYCSGVDEAEAVSEAVAVLRQADLSVLEVTSQGTLDERRASGEEIGDDERDLMERALAENAVIVAMLTPYFD